MKYLKQFGIILSISFIGEALNAAIPLPIPASIYGIVIMFICLCTGIIKIAGVKETSKFLVDTMPIMFVPPSAALIDAWGILQPIWFPFIFISAVTTFIVMAAGGLSSQFVIRMQSRRNHSLSNTVNGGDK